MKTIFIWNEGFEYPLKYFVLEGDYRHLHGTMINCATDPDLEEELAAILNYDEKGNSAVKFLDTFPVNEVQGDTAVIEVGFIP